MPRRKKTDQSPARLPHGPPMEWGSVGHHTDFQPPLAQGHSAVTGCSNSVSSSSSEDVVKSMQEMFSHLDPEVIYIVLSECDFKVDIAMDSLLELSVAAEGAALVHPPVSSFEQTAAALLGPYSFSEPKPDPDPSKPSLNPSSSLPEDILSEELDLLIDQELETFNTQKEQHNSSKLLSEASISFPPLHVPPQQALPELLQSSLELGPRGPLVEDSTPAGNLVRQMPASSSVLNDLSTWDTNAEKGQQSLVDFTHLITEASADKPNTSFDLAASGRSSAFQVYKKQEPLQLQSEQAWNSHPDAAGRTSLTGKTFHQQPTGCVSSPWNQGLPVFPSYNPGHSKPTFIYPVAQTPWHGNPGHLSPMINANPIGQAPIKHHATIPKSWALTTGSHVPVRNNRLHLEGKVLVLLRGPPGSGKSTLARALLECNPGGVILSTDDYFIHNRRYYYNPALLGEAHHWNQKRAMDAFIRGANPIIIDNTNMQGWEMKPYVIQALQHRYKVLFREPDTWWKNKPRELARRTTHAVQLEKIRHMLDHYERFVTVQTIMGSHMPEWKNPLLHETSGPPTYSSDTTCPDLVGQKSNLNQSKKSHPQMFSSLPDVSSIGRSGQDGTKKSTESLNFQDSGGLFDDADGSERGDLEFNYLSSEPDSHIDLDSSIGDKRMPDCIVESVINEDQFQDDTPVAFSESIKQRTKRERSGRGSGFQRDDHTEVIKDTNQSESKTEGKDPTGEEETGDVGLKTYKIEKESFEQLHFEGDWPSEGPLQQRKLKKREIEKAVCGEENEIKSQNVDDSETSVEPGGGPNFKEFQKLLDLIQPVADHTDASASPSLSPSSGEQLELAVVVESISEESNTNQNTKKLHGKTGELPDCVLDWNASRESESHCEEEPGAKSEECSSIGIITSMAAKMCKEGVGEHSYDSAGSLDGDTDRKNRTEDNDSLLSETCLSPGESDGTMVGSHDRKQQRRSGKHCKLALTFTQNCSNSSLMSQDSPETTPQNLESSKNSASSIITPNFDSYSSPLPQQSLATDTKLEADVQSQAPHLPLEKSSFTQTESQDFAFLWRLNSRESSDYAAITTYSHHSDITVLSSDPSRFIPDISSALSAAVAVQPSEQGVVPYRVVHEKGTHVEEKDFGGTNDRLESLRILSRHFRLVSFDILEDLYEKCHQDLEWTTNLLLDSGERFFRGENDAAEEVSQSLSKEFGALDINLLCSDAFKDYQQEGFPTSEPTKDETQRPTCETASEPEDTMFNVDIIRSAGGAAEDQSQQHPNTRFEELSPETNTMTKGLISDITECKVMLELDPEAPAWGENFDIKAIIKDSGVEMEDDTASMDEVNRVLQAELETMEREENQRKAASHSKNLDIQSVELNLPTELALQLTELFGPVGVDPGTCSCEDYVVLMNLNFAKLLHQKWKDSIQERQKQTNLSFHLLQESSAKLGQWGQPQFGNFTKNTDGCTLADIQPGAQSQMPFMDHWNVSRPHVSLRDIIKEEQALHQTIERLSFVDKAKSCRPRPAGWSNFAEGKPALFSLPEH
ncbi:NEDD4-binding protein 2 isoform X2 [Gouania willdenowi]|uniref:NEDD4-binding protein 2 isoform X2 n=1 Tax=Gouania willdenowi TaxID=441366 RepID=UPI00105479F6|nr:NEDD4-binding protein 2 isoform X2 [Gouania willdenowi]